MKAKIKETGEIIEVENLYDDGTALVGDTFYKVSELDFDSVIDWEQRRYEISKAMIAAFMSNSDKNVFAYPKKNQARDAVEYADALIEELKKRK